MSEILVLTEADVRRALTMTDAIAAMRTAFAALSAGEADVPLRTTVPLMEGVAISMPCALGEHAGVKFATVHPKNPGIGLPAVGALLILVSACTGEPVALFSARALTALRTGAGSGLATDLLALPDASVCAVVGAGAQAETQLEAVCAVRPIERALVVTRSRSHAETFAALMSDRLSIPVEVADRRRIREAQVVCVATGSPTPVLTLADVGAGAHINAVGAHHPQQAELDAALVRASYVVVDHRATCKAEAGDLLLAGLDVGALPEIGDVASGSAPGRAGSEQITLFKSVGNAVQDLAAAAHAVSIAQQKEFGTRVPL